MTRWDDAFNARVQRVERPSLSMMVLKSLRDLDGSGAAVPDYLNGPKIDDNLRQTMDSDNPAQDFTKAPCGLFGRR